MATQQEASGHDISKSRDAQKPIREVMFPSDER